MSPSQTILSLLDAFVRVHPADLDESLGLALGTILARGPAQRSPPRCGRWGTMTPRNFSKYHQVFNRTVLSPLRLGADWCMCWSGLSPLTGRPPLRHRRDVGASLGPHIRIRGHYRDPLASSKKKSVAASGHSLIVLR